MILFRLMNGGKVVGYEKHEGGGIYHKEGKGWWHDIFAILPAFLSSKTPFYITHDRKDQYTGVTTGGVKLFHRDKVDFTIKDAISGHGYGGLGVIVYRPVCFEIQKLDTGEHFNLISRTVNDEIKIIGVAANNTKGEHHDTKR